LYCQELPRPALLFLAQTFAVFVEVCAMLTNQLDHPKMDRLSAFVLGKLESAEAEAIESHLAGCKPCCETLNQIQDDTFVELLRECRPAPGASHDDTTVSTRIEDSPGATAQAETEAPLDGMPRPGFDLPVALVDHPRYRVMELVGSGGMGSVYTAEHRLMQRSVALKVIHPEFTRNEEAVERFRREVRAAAKLVHPNIVHAYDAEQAGNVHFLVMEYVPGTDLGMMLEERGPLPVAEACDFIRQAALGLQHAHEHGMVHRDIKPQNLMVVSGGAARGAATGSSADHAPG